MSIEEALRIRRTNEARQWLDDMGIILHATDRGKNHPTIEESLEELGLVVDNITEADQQA